MMTVAAPIRNAISTSSSRSRMRSMDAPPAISRRRPWHPGFVGPGFAVRAIGYLRFPQWCKPAPMSVPDPAPLIAKAPVIPVLTVERVEDALPLARALVAGGLPVIEVTLRTPVALDAVRAIVDEVPECVVGVGTVTEVTDIRLALAAGAKYLVSPGTTPDLADAFARAPVPVVPGCATVSEAMVLAGRGFRVLKFFPAEAA